MTKKASTTTSVDTSQSKDPLIGKQLGDYRLTSVLATGGMARIYKAMDYKLQRQAAIKVLAQDEVDSDQTLTKRFQREARAVAQLEHDNIITIYQYGEHEGVYFLAMKLVKGKDLAQELKRLKKSGHKLDVKRALRIMEQVASALDYAHAAEVVHRDIKPSNILLDDDDKAILTDFGLVLRTSVETTMGTAFGTPRYIAPEQAISSNKALPQSDIYSLAVIMYEILAGETPFNGESPMEIALSHISDPVPAPRTKNKDIPESVERELLKALEKEPEKRHKSASDFIKAIKKGYGIGVEAKAAVPVPSPSPTQMTSPSIVSESSKALLENWTLPKAQTTPKGTTSGKRSRIRLLLFLLVIVSSVGAFLVLNGRGGSGVPGAPITLMYNEFNFTMFNGGDYDLNVFELNLVRGVNGGGDDFSGDRVRGDTLPSTICFRVSLQGKQNDAPPQCTKIQSAELLTNQSLLFWRKETDSDAVASTFEVQYKGQVIARCNTVGRGEDAECRFNWPVPPPTATPPES
ncbi:MAG: serine/threonine protein kinase [Anaerolineae bacterium]|nr:serine/threonine protein kinase [Anaerolineae bacterium]